MEQRQEHPPLRRFLWSPWAALFCVALLTGRGVTAGFTTFRIVGIVVTGVYFALTLVNAWTRGGLLDSLYEEPAVKWKEQVDEYKRRLEESARLSAESKRQLEESERRSEEHRTWYLAQRERETRVLAGQEEVARRSAALLDRLEALATRAESFLARWEQQRGTT